MVSSMGTSQYCSKCGHVGPRHVVEESPRGRGAQHRYACAACGSQDVSPCTACADCRAALAVIEEQCVPCAVEFFRAHPLEFNPAELTPAGGMFWLLTPAHADAAHRIREAIDRHNGVKAA